MTVIPSLHGTIANESYQPCGRTLAVQLCPFEHMAIMNTWKENARSAHESFCYAQRTQTKPLNCLHVHLSIDIDPGLDPWRTT